MKRKALVKVLESAGYRFLRDDGDHTVYTCPCGKHRAPVPRHTDISAGVVRSIVQKGECMKKGWLQ